MQQSLCDMSKNDGVDVLELSKYFDDWVRSQKTGGAFNFALYETINRPQAISPEGLLQNFKFLQGFLKKCPHAQMNPSQLRFQFLRFPKENSGTLRCDLWAGQRAERMTTLLKHVRRLKDPIKFRQAADKSTPDELQAMEKLAKSCDIDGYASEPERFLTEQVSVDSDGFPKISATQDDSAAESEIPAVQKSKKPANSAKTETLNESLFAAALQNASKAAASFAKTAGSSDAPKKTIKKVLKKPSAAPEKKQSAASTKKDAPEPDKGESLDSATWGRLYVTIATAQSYIQYVDRDTQKKKLLVAVSAGQAAKTSKEHSSVIKALTEKALLAKMTVDKIKAFRAELLAR